MVQPNITQAQANLDQIIADLTTQKATIEKEAVKVEETLDALIVAMNKIEETLDPLLAAKAKLAQLNPNHTEQPVLPAAQQPVIESAPEQATLTAVNGNISPVPATDNPVEDSPIEEPKQPGIRLITPPSLPKGVKKNVGLNSYVRRMLNAVIKSAGPMPETLPEALTIAWEKDWDTKTIYWPAGQGHARQDLWLSAEVSDPNSRMRKMLQDAAEVLRTNKREDLHAGIWQIISAFDERGIDPAELLLKWALN